MITTVTLNPAVDKTYTAEELIPGQVNRMETVVKLAGGKGINVAKALRCYEQPVRAMGFLGGYSGRLIEDYAEKIKVCCAFTHISGETRSSMNILDQNGYVTEILEPGPHISKKELQSFLGEYENVLDDSELIILSGSVPGGVPEDIYGTLIEIAKKKQKRVVLDSSGIYMREGVRKLPFMIKPNWKELEALMGRKVKDREDAIGAALHLHSQGIEHVFVSMGEKGLIYVCRNEVYYARPPFVWTVNTVGCGDSVVAAFAMSIMAGDGPEDTIRKATAVSAANATTPESGIVPVNTAEKLLSEIEVIRY